MALCTSCGNQVEESASFCTSCGKPMPAAAHPSAAVSVTRSVCSSCGALGDPGSVFCTECGKRLDAQATAAESVPASAVAASAPLEVETAAPTTSPNPFCTSCGSKLEPGTGFCTNCGQPLVSSSAVTAAPTTKVATPAPAFEATQPVRVEPVIAPVASAEPTRDAIATELVVAAPPLSRMESTPAAVAAEPLVENRSVVEDRPVVAAPVKPAPVATSSASCRAGVCRAQRLPASTAIRRSFPHNRSGPAAVDRGWGFWRLVFYGRGNCGCLQPA